MTDPEMADVTYIEPITWQMRREDHRQASAPTRCCRPWAARPRSTARSTSRAHGVLEKYGVELIGASQEGDREGRGPREVQGGDDPHRPRFGALGHRAHACEEALAGAGGDRLPGGHPARPSRWAAPAAASPTTRRSSTRSASAASTQSPTQRAADRGVAARLEGVRDGGGARHRPTTASSSARSRTSTRWACTPATRSPSRRRRR